MESELIVGSAVAMPGLASLALLSSWRGKRLGIVGALGERHKESGIVARVRLPRICSQLVPRNAIRKSKSHPKKVMRVSTQL